MSEPRERSVGSRVQSIPPDTSAESGAGWGEGLPDSRLAIVGGHGILRVRTIGAFIREQRLRAPCSPRQLSKLAGVSNPYLSQIERGLRKPSADILRQIAKGLRISAEQLYIRAGILQDRPGKSELIGAILTDTMLTERQRSVLAEIYESFHRENQANDTGESAGSSLTVATTNAATPATEKVVTDMPIATDVRAYADAALEQGKTVLSRATTAVNTAAERAVELVKDAPNLVFRTAWNLPPAKLGRFLVATVVPGEYARDVRRRHEELQRIHDENTLRVLASVALWQRKEESPTCLQEAEVVLREFCRQSDAELDNALDPHAAAVAKSLLEKWAHSLKIRR